MYRREVAYACSGALPEQPHACTYICNFHVKINVTILTCEYNLAYISYIRKVKSSDFTPNSHKFLQK